MRLTRYVQKLFGSTAGATQLGKFGSLAAGSPEFATTPAEVQELSNYLGGWYNAIVGSNSPAIQDRNGLDYLFSYQLAYLMQQGVAEWQTDTEYFQGQICSDGNGQLYASITDDNQGNALTDTSNWARMGGNSYLPFVTYSAGEKVFYDNNTWISRQGSNTGNTPAIVSEWWRLDTGKVISEYIDAPVDSISGAIYCNGDPFSRTTYADLFAAIGTTFGAGDGSTTFNVPDFRGRYNRYPDDTAGVDPNTGAIGDIQTRLTARPTSNFTTNNNGNHNHGSGPTSTTGVIDSRDAYGRRDVTDTPDSISGGSSTGTHTWNTSTDGNHNHSVTGGGDNDTRPESLVGAKRFIVF
jgi:phage-related tail fiber protein